MDADQIIIEPLLTEKTNRMREEHMYAFRVDARANKLEIRSAIETLFSVHPTDCRVVNVKRKPKRVRYRQGHTASWKKAIVTLPPGESIGIFEGA
jgi:large subunit ribosomal protein L23